MGMLTEYSIDDLLANEAQRPVLEQMAAAMAGTQSMEMLFRVLRGPPKSESRLAWEAAHLSFGDQVQAGLDAADRASREIFVGESGCATPEMQRAGCRR